MELRLSTNYFILDNRVCILENSSSFDLALIVMISKVFPQRLESIAMQEALTLNLARLAYERYNDDIHARFQIIQQSHSFLNNLDKQNKAIQYPMKKEDIRLPRRYHDEHWRSKMCI